MDALKPFVALFQRLSRVQQLGLGIVAVVVVGLLLVLSTVARTPDMLPAYSGLSNDEASAIVAKLKDAKVPYTVGEGGTILVPGAMVSEVRVLMAGQGLGGGKASGGAGFELFNQAPIGQTDFNQKVNYQRALEGEIARSIMRFDAVDSARVHLAVPQQALFASQQKDTTASVILKLKPGKQLDRGQVKAISSLVTGSVEGLKPQNLAIVDVNGNVLTDDSGGPDRGLSNRQLDQEQAVASATEHDLQQVLDRVLGSGKAAVRVSALLNWDTMEQTSETYTQAPDGSVDGVKLTTHESYEKRDPGADTGGVPGVASNGATVPTYQGQSGGQSGAYEKRDIQTTYEPAKTVQKTVRAPGTVKRLNVSVILDQASVDEAQVDAIRTALSVAAGLDTQGRGDQIAVTALPFNRDDLKNVEADMAQAQQREQVLSYVRLGALALGPVLLLLVTWRVLARGGKDRPKSKGKGRDALAAMAADQVPAAMAADLVARQQGASGRAVNLVAAEPLRPIPTRPIPDNPHQAQVHDQITKLGKTNPATVAQLIQTWMEEDRRN